MDTKEKIVIIDGNSLVFRAFYAFKTPMITSRGIFTQAIFGFLNMLAKALEDTAPDYIAVAFDRKAPTFRHLEYKEYKAGRAKTPDELHMQLPYIKDILAAMRIAILEMDGFEADDIIGTLVKRAEAAGLEPLVITGDRDELQLVSDKTSVLITKKGVSEFELNTPESMHGKYGFGPELFVDYKGLMGDASDNIPGLPGVGEKTAAKLVMQFGTVENLLAHVDEVESERLRGIISDGEQRALMSKRLATIVTDAPVDMDFEGMRVREWDKPRLREIYTELEFRSFLKKLGPGGPGGVGDGAAQTGLSPGSGGGAGGDSAGGDGAGGGMEGGDAGTRKPYSAGPVERIELDLENIEISIIENVEGLVGVREALEGAREAVLHSFGSDDHVYPPLVDAIFIYVDKRFFCIWTRGEDRLLASVCEMLAPLELGLAGFGLKDDLYRIRRTLALARTAGDGRQESAAGTARSDSDEAAARTATPGSDSDEAFPAEEAGGPQDGFRPRAVFDAGIADYLLVPGGSAPGLAQLAMAYGGIALREAPDFSKDILAFDKGSLAGIGLESCAAIEALRPALERQLADKGLTKLFEEVEMPLVDTLAETEMNGFAYDAAAMDGIAATISERIDVLTGSITDLAGEAFNINSPKQLGDILFEKLGMKGGKKNKNGYSTSADILEKLRDGNPIVEQVLEYRMLVKLRGTYIEGLPSFVCGDGKIRAHLMQGVTATGRLSCTDPNLQNIPIRREPGRQLRKAFVPESEDYVLMAADYSQIELRVLAHLSGDPSLIEDFRSGADIHSRTAARVFGLADGEEVTIEQRSGAKAVNFGIIYGMSSFGLSEELSITRKDAEGYIAEYFRRHEAVKAYMDGCVTEAREKGYSATILGRRRPIPEIMASQYMVRQLGERLAMNSPVQGSAADIIKIAMNRVRAALKEEGLVSRLILQVHDELILQVKKGEEEAAAAILKREMEGAFELKVPLETEVKTGANWYELK